MIEEPRDDEAPEPDFADEEHGGSEPEDPNAGPAPAAVEPEEASAPPPNPAPWVDALIEDLDGKTVEELHDVARQRGLHGYSTLSKDELVAAISADYRERPPLEPRIG